MLPKRYGRDIWPGPPPPPTTTNAHCTSSNADTKDDFRWTAKELRFDPKGSLSSHVCRELEDGGFLGYRANLSVRTCPLVDVNGDPMNQDRPWWTNGFTAGWNPLSPLYLGGVMALVGSAIGASMRNLNKNTYCGD